MFGLGLGSGWSGPTCKVEVDDTRPAHCFVPTGPAHSGSHFFGEVFLQQHEDLCSAPSNRFSTKNEKAAEEKKKVMVETS